MLDKVSMSTEIRKTILIMESTIEDAKKHKQLSQMKIMIASRPPGVKRRLQAFYKAALKTATKLPKKGQEKLLLDIQRAL